MVASTLSDLLVIGAASGYNINQVAAFLNSLLATGYQGEIVIFVDAGKRKEFESAWPQQNIRFVPIRTLRPPMGRLYQNRLFRKLIWLPLEYWGWLLVRCAQFFQQPGIAVGLAKAFYKPHYSRFFWYRDVISAGRYQRILLADVRDVWFQSDPFDDFPEQGFVVGMETDHYTLASEPHNAEWLVRAYGPDYLKKIGHEPVSCSGVTYGSREQMLTYLDAMVEQTLKLGFLPCWYGCDQAVHNFLILEDGLNPVTRLDTLRGTIATLNDLSRDEIQINSSNLLLNRDGSLPAIVHQYDRIPGLAAELGIQ